MELLWEFYRCFYGNPFGALPRIGLHFLHGSSRKSFIVPSEIYPSSFRNFAGEFPLEFLRGTLHGCIRDFSRVCLNIIPPTISLKSLQEFLGKSFKNLFRFLHRISLKILREFLQIYSVNSFVAPSGIFSDFLQIALWLFFGNFSRSSPEI